MAGEDLAGYMVDLPWKVVESIIITLLAGVAVTLLSSGIASALKLKSQNTDAVISVWKKFTDISGGGNVKLGAKVLVFIRELAVFLAGYVFPAAIFVYVFTHIITRLMTGNIVGPVGYIEPREWLISIILASVLLPFPGFRSIVKVLARLVTRPLFSAAVGFVVFVIIAHILQVISVPLAAWADQVPMSQVWDYYFSDFSTTAADRLRKTGVIFIVILLLSVSIGFVASKRVWTYLQDRFDDDLF